MHQGGTEQFDAELFVAGQGTAFVVKSPAKDLPYRFLDQIAFYGLRRLSGVNALSPVLIAVSEPLQLKGLMCFPP